jgi:Spy/CpxP family protein refolding chaperone
MAFVSGDAIAQQSPPPEGAGEGMNPLPSPAPLEQRRPPMERAFHLGPPGRWWNNTPFATQLGLTTEQQKRMEMVFEQNRPTLINLNAAVRKAEAEMEPLLAADQPDEAKVLAQIDRIAQARTELEKANARMLLGMRRILTREQWTRLQADDPGRHGHPGLMSQSHDGRGPQPNE